MAPASAAAAIQLLSPTELAYLHSSLSLSPPQRTDARSPTQFRPLVAESDILPGANGSARICFADGTEAVVGCKAEVERKAKSSTVNKEEGYGGGILEMSIEIPGFRDDDSLPVFLAEMMCEALLASGDLARRLGINSRYHWKLNIDVGLLDQHSIQ
jgi:exosome complex component RRP42